MNKHTVKLTNILAQQDKDKVYSGYMAIARYFVDHLYNDKYKVTMNNYLYAINEIVIIDIDTIKSMIIQYVEFKRYWDTVSGHTPTHKTKTIVTTDFLSTIGVSFTFNEKYMSTIDDNPEVYDEVYNVLLNLKIDV